MSRGTILRTVRLIREATGERILDDVTVTIHTGSELVMTNPQSRVDVGRPRYTE